MVSLINFKVVNEELKHPTSKKMEGEQEVPTVTVVKVQHHEAQTPISPEDQYNFHLNSPLSQDITALQDHKQDITTQLSYDSNCNRSSSSETSNIEQLSFKSTGRSSDFHPSADSLVVAPGDRQNFVVTWRSLRYVIEPKWHQRVLEANLLSSWTKRACRGLLGEQKADIAANLDQTPSVNKMVLDRLDGSFRSGELTAVLGPSGKLTVHLRTTHWVTGRGTQLGSMKNRLVEQGSKLPGQAKLRAGDSL